MRRPDFRLLQRSEEARERLEYRSQTGRRRKVHASLEEWQKPRLHPRHLLAPGDDQRNLVVEEKTSPVHVRAAENANLVVDEQDLRVHHPGRVAANDGSSIAQLTKVRRAREIRGQVI